MAAETSAFAVDQTVTMRSKRVQEKERMQAAFRQHVKCRLFALTKENYAISITSRKYNRICRRSRDDLEDMTSATVYLLPLNFVVVCPHEMPAHNGYGLATFRYSFFYEIPTQLKSTSRTRGRSAMRSIWWKPHDGLRIYERDARTTKYKDTKQDTRDRYDLAASEKDQGA
ncbi:hypothetical protein EI94DRAFT_1730136 [Lactarius quietus]|nr:hypothetical protein EI94DRAFT_1730136 [Lactarius quietus]